MESPFTHVIRDRWDLQISHHSTPLHWWSQSWMKLSQEISLNEVISQNSTMPLLFKSPTTSILLRRNSTSLLYLWVHFYLTGETLIPRLASDQTIRSCFILLGIMMCLHGRERRQEELFVILSLDDQALKTELLPESRG